MTTNKAEERKKSETRRPKPERRPKTEIRNLKPDACASMALDTILRLQFQYSDSGFGFRASFGFRPSGFGLRP
jgi:hypothetical protein